MTTHYRAQYGLPENGDVIKELVVCWEFPNLILGVFGRKVKNRLPLVIEPGLKLSWKRKKECIFSFN